MRTVCALLLAVLGMAAVSQAVIATDTLMDVLHCDLDLLVNDVSQADELPNALISTSTFSIKLKFRNSTYLSSVYVKINTASISAQCYNQSLDISDAAVPGRAAVAYTALSNTMEIKPGNLRECLSPNIGCDGFVFQSVQFLRLFPSSCIRHIISFTAGLYHGENDTIPFATHFSTASVGGGSGGNKQQQQPKQTWSTRGMRTLATVPSSAVAIGTTDFVDPQVNFTAVLWRLAYVHEPYDTAEQLGVWIPIGIVGLVVIGAAVFIGVKGGAAGTAAVSEGVGLVSGRLSHSDADTAGYRRRSSTGRRMGSGVGHVGGTRGGHAY